MIRVQIPSKYERRNETSVNVLAFTGQEDKSNKALEKGKKKKKYNTHEKPN